MYTSQYKQDQYLEENVFKGYTHGIFVDVGAHDGVSINNTLYFETYNNWTGINIEPNKKVYDTLVLNRPNSINIEYAVCNHDGVTKFLCNSGYTEMISGIKDTFHPYHYQRLQTENIHTDSTTELITVQTKKLETILDEQNISHVHYLTIDVEGGEFEVIKSINFEKVYIDVIQFENNYEDVSNRIVQYLEAKNYTILRKAEDIFMIHKNSMFRLHSEDRQNRL